MSSHHGILLHVIFSTKYRKPYLGDAWRDDLFAFIGITVRDHKATLLKSGGIEDHVHLLLRIHPQFAISNTIQLLKSNSSRWINQNRLITGRFEWQRGYGAFSVSNSMAAAVTDYIAKQREHHRNRSFEDEYLDFLRKHQIDFDPRYAFESEFVG